MELVLNFLVALIIYLIPIIAISSLMSCKRRFIYSSIITLFGLPLVAFFCAWILGISISISLIAVLAILSGFIFLIKRNRPHPKFSIRHIIVFGLFLFVFGLAFFNFEGLGLGYWDSYIIFPSALMSGSQVDVIDLGGNFLYDSNPNSGIPNDLIDEASYGLSSKDQRIGSAIFFSIPYLLFGAIGFRLYYALIIGLLFLAGYSLSRNVFGKFYLSIFCGLLLSLNPYIFVVNRLNPNILGLLLLTVICTLIFEKKPNWLFIGVLFGILGGIRNVALLFGPALLFFVFFNKNLSWRHYLWRKDLLFLILGALIFITPILMWNNFAFGNVLEHPTQFPGLYGFRPTFEHSFLGFDFEFNGLLNFPFSDKIVRTPHFAFPTFLTLPLTLVRTFGLMGIALILLGAYNFRKEKSALLFLLIFFIPFFLFLIIQENWEDVKSTFVLLVFPTLVLFLTSGLKYFVSKNASLVSRLLRIGIVVMFVLIALNAVENFDAEKDYRWFERFPGAKAYVDEDFIFEDWNMRDEWLFFHKDETQDELAFQKAKLTEFNLFPTYDSFDFHLAEINKEIPNNKLHLLNVWFLIYGGTNEGSIE